MPEEINRVLTDHVADVLFAPTSTAETNLLREGIDSSKIQLVGDVMYDAALFYDARARRPEWFEGKHAAQGFALCTMHRAENTDDVENLRGILAGLSDSPVSIILPLHPRTRKKVQEAGLSWPATVRVVDPVGYLEMVWLEANCQFVLTDSGGVQKEAFFHRKPCITLREETEWVELVSSGWNTLAGANAERISKCISSVSAPEVAPALYGRGDASRKVVEGLR
jgi:UDP-GlcNAc3NAcA epimerase